MNQTVKAGEWRLREIKGGRELQEGPFQHLAGTEVVCPLEAKRDMAVNRARWAGRQREGPLRDG